MGYIWFLILVMIWFPRLFAAPPYNQLLIQVIQDMPKGGGYDTSDATLKLLEPAVQLNPASSPLTLEVNPQKARPSFCSGATYLAFLKLLSRLQKEKQLELSEATQKELLVKGQADGSGIWGRWNANGPGTARLFYELGLGRNFTMEKLSEAEPGDFLKIFWTDEIGVKEFGHSVIFTGLRQNGNKKSLCFWSSNKSNAENAEAGMGEKCVDLKKIRRGLFSRLEHPERLNEIPKKIAPHSDAYVDSYLKSMLEKKSNAEEVCLKVGCS